MKDYYRVLKLSLWVHVFIAVFVMASTGYAQSLGTFASGQAQYEEEEILTTEDIQQILAQEGIPIGGSAQINIENASKYTLGVDDVIDIGVLRHPEVSGQYVINMEGKIQYEFVGDILIVGKTKIEVAQVIIDRLSKFIISPEVTVKIAEYNSKVVYVVGEVGAPGKIPMRGDTITIREALVQAHFPLLSGKVSKAKMITPTASGKPAITSVNIHKLLYEGDLRENLVMKPGDTLYIPPTIMAKTLRAIQPITQPITTTAGAAGAVGN
jgi:protein involved in polysaccharide export with SLBB domain